MQDEISVTIGCRTFIPAGASGIKKPLPVTYGTGILRAFDSAGLVVWDREASPHEVTYWLPAGSLDPGEYTLEFRADKRIDIANNEGNTAASTSIDVFVSSTLVVVTEGEDVFSVNQDDATVDAIKQVLNVGCCIGIRRIPLSCSCPSFNATGPMPVNAWFEIIVEVDGTEQRLGSIELMRDVPLVLPSMRLLTNLTDDTELTIILSSDLEAARRSDRNVDSVWDGEIRFDSVPIEGPGD